MFKKRYKAIVPISAKKEESINLVNSMLIKLRYYWEKVEIHKRKGSKPNENKYFEFLKMYRNTVNNLNKLGVQIKKKKEIKRC